MERISHTRESTLPIFDRSYRAYDGQLRTGLAWWVIVKQEMRVIFPTRSFLVLLGFCLAHVVLRLLQIVAFDILASNPDSSIAHLVREFPLKVDSELFYQFLTTQSFLLFGMILYAGAGMICDDVRNNLMEVYFSKPITWVDYTLGKILTLVLLGLGLSAAPAILLVVLHNILAPGWETLEAAIEWPLAISLYSCLIVVPCSLVVLAGSALLKNQRDVTISVVVLVIVSFVLPESVSNIFDNTWIQIASIPGSIFNIGAQLFSVDSEPLDLSPWHSVIVVVSISLLFLGVICRKVHSCEVEV